MDLKISSQKRRLPSSSDYTSDPDEEEISEGEDEDDDRNHKHRKKDTRGQSLEGDSPDQGLSRPYNKRNKPFMNGYSYREGDLQSGREFPSRFEKRRFNQSPLSRAPFDLNHRFRGNQMMPVEGGPIGSRGMDSWGLHDSRLGLADVASQMVHHGPVPPGLFAGSRLPNIPNAQSKPWSAFGLVPRVPNGGLDGLHPLGFQGTLRPAICPPMNVGIPRERCRDFEERGFCLRGDMCPMEHGVNRIVIDDFQSLSQLNLPVPVSGSQLLGTSGQGTLSGFSASPGSLLNNKSVHANYSKPGMAGDGFGINYGVVGNDMGASDVYDPDQPLWAKDKPETSAELLAHDQSNADKTESILDMDPSDQQSIESCEQFGDVHAFRTATGAGSQSSSVWGRIGSSKRRSILKENDNSIGPSSNYFARDTKNEETLRSGLPSVPNQGKLTNADKAFKPNGDSVRNIQKPSHKALRTLFVKGIPLKDNRKEPLLSHFRKFGDVVDICIPMHSDKAFVQFSRREEAEAALKAPDAVMGNRFVKLWWANRDNISDDLVSGTSSVPTNPHGVTPNAAPSHPNVPNKQKENPHSAGGKDDKSHAFVAQVQANTNSLTVVSNGPKAASLQHKKLETLELLREELRKKQEMFEQKRNEFKSKLRKLEKQAAAAKDLTSPNQASKSLKGETSTDHSKDEKPKPSPKARIAPENINSDSGGGTQTSDCTVVLKDPLRPPTRPQLPLRAPFVVNRFKLDNRPTSFRILSPIPAALANVSALKEHFSFYGDLSLVELEESEIPKINNAAEPLDVTARVSFTTRRSAEKAFLHGKCWQGHNLQFMWHTPTNAGKDNGGPGNLSGSSNGPSDSAEAGSTHSQKTAVPGSVEPENPTRESEVESVEQVTDSKSTST